MRLTLGVQKGSAILTDPISILERKLVALDFQCSEGIVCKFSGGEAEIVLHSVEAEQDTEVAFCLVKEYERRDPLEKRFGPRLPGWWYLEDYMILKGRQYPESGRMGVQLKTFPKQRKKREYPESEQIDSYGTDGETAGRMATSAKFQSISQDQSAYNNWVGQMRVQLKTFPKQRKKREYPESEQIDSYGTDGETAGRMATSAKFQSISQDQSAYNNWVGQMRVQLKTFPKQRKKREYPESEQIDSYGTDGETAGRMATSAKFQSISQDQSAYNNWVGQMRVQLKTFPKQRKKREYPESEQIDSYGTDGETAGRMATSAKFQSISQDQSAYNHWVGKTEPDPEQPKGKEEESEEEDFVYPEPSPQPSPETESDESQSEEVLLVPKSPIHIIIHRRAYRSLVYPDSDPDTPTPKPKPCCVGKRCCFVGRMFLFVVLVLAVTFAAWVARKSWVVRK